MCIIIISDDVWSFLLDEWNSWPDTRFCDWCHNVQPLWILDEWNEDWRKWTSVMPFLDWLCLTWRKIIKWLYPLCSLGNLLDDPHHSRARILLRQLRNQSLPDVLRWFGQEGGGRLQARKICDYTFCESGMFIIRTCFHSKQLNKEVSANWGIVSLLFVFFPAEFQMSQCLFFCPETWGLQTSRPPVGPVQWLQFRLYKLRQESPAEPAELRVEDEEEA